MLTGLITIKQSLYYRRRHKYGEMYCIELCVESVYVKMWERHFYRVLSSHSKLIEAELWAYGHVWKSDLFNYVTMWEGPDYTGARPLGSMHRFGP